MKKFGEGNESSRGMEIKAKELTSSSRNFRRVDSLNIEAEKVTSPRGYADPFDWKTTLGLAFKSLGVVYGDIGTSPLYVFSSTFPDGVQNKDDILGVLSLIFYTIVLVPLVKYVCIVLWCNDHGDEDRELSHYRLDTVSTETTRAQNFKHKLEKNRAAKVSLFLVTILGTSMVIGDGVLTACISVLSAVSGIKSLGQEAVSWISVAILICLFCLQRFGTDKVGVIFGPVIFLWFGLITVIGLYDLFTYNIGVLGAINPLYIIDYFKRNGKTAWISLGGVILCITGAEAMFADLGHFSVRSIQISFSGVVMPSILIAYGGQASYLSQNPGDVGDTFYAAVPHPLYWPTFIVAVLAAIIASQALISGAFSIIAQSLTLGCFPRVKVVHTSPKHEGQVYIPEINYILMICCVVITITFKTTEQIGNAYGLALLYSELVQGIPSIFSHFVANIPSIHSVLVFVSIKSVPISKVLLEERFLFRRVEPREYKMFRCVVSIFNGAAIAEQLTDPRDSTGSSGPFDAPIPEAEKEMQFVQKAMEKGVVYLFGESEVSTKKNSSIFKRFIVNYAYSFLQKNCRKGERLTEIPKSKLLRVGMTYEI
ncbi:hypothetical protein Pint_05572 [Pistacia integerrima]|uniref:Uncharacterized protein n=1 Tax=Pistacia integerrima TaxID=434235 RepID=A0ACC0Z7E2_9ROSI|nr:hypothetical protein Pint_05572 [Pistacia integerrima]